MRAEHGGTVFLWDVGAYGVVTRATAIWILTVVRTSNLISNLHWKHFSVRHCNCDWLTQEQGLWALFVSFKFIQIQLYEAITLHRNGYLAYVSVCAERRLSGADTYVTYELTVAQIVKKFPVFQGNPNVQHRVHYSPSPAFKLSHPVSLKAILILSSHLQQFLLVTTKYLPYRRMFKIQIVDLNIILYYDAGMSGDLISSCDIQWSLSGRPALSMCRCCLEEFRSILCYVIS
jgi:hypothetical protein